MFFSKLSVLAAVAFSAFAAAIPLSNTNPLGGLPVDPSAVTGLIGNLPALGGGIVPRDAPKSIAVILTGVQAQLEPVAASLGKWPCPCLCVMFLLISI